MKAKKVRIDDVKVQERFFDAIDALSQLKKIRGLKTICRGTGLSYQKYSRLRMQVRNPEFIMTYKTIDIYALVLLVKEYKVSADWLLLGKGKMFEGIHLTALRSEKYA